jgi:hypothetical protein
LKRDSLAPAKVASRKRASEAWQQFEFRQTDGTRKFVTRDRLLALAADQGDLVSDSGIWDAGEIDEEMLHRGEPQSSCSPPAHQDRSPSYGPGQASGEPDYGYAGPDHAPTVRLDAAIAEAGAGREVLDLDEP